MMNLVDWALENNFLNKEHGDKEIASLVRWFRRNFPIKLARVRKNVYEFHPLHMEEYLAEYRKKQSTIQARRSENAYALLAKKQAIKNFTEQAQEAHVKDPVNSPPPPSPVVLRSAQGLRIPEFVRILNIERDWLGLAPIAVPGAAAAVSKKAGRKTKKNSASKTPEPE
jgi:hypothetical protein